MKVIKYEKPLHITLSLQKGKQNHFKTILLDFLLPHVALAPQQVRHFPGKFMKFICSSICLHHFFALNSMTKLAWNN